MGKFLSQFGRNEEALASFIKAVDIDPNIKSGYNNIAVALGQLGKKDEAVVYYRKAVAINPTDMDA